MQVTNISPSLGISTAQAHPTWILPPILLLEVKGVQHHQEMHVSPKHNKVSDVATLDNRCVTPAAKAQSAMPTALRGLKVLVQSLPFGLARQLVGLMSLPVIETHFPATHYKKSAARTLVGICSYCLVRPTNQTLIWDIF